MTSTNDVVFKLRELKPILYAKYSVKGIGLFGSFADDTQTEESNIDILIALEKSIGWKFLLWNHILKMYLREKLIW